MTKKTYYDEIQPVKEDLLLQLEAMHEIISETANDTILSTKVFSFCQNDIANIIKKVKSINYKNTRNKF